MLYSVQPRNRMFVKSYGFWFFAKNMGKNIGKYISSKYISIYKYISSILSGKYSQKRF